MSPQSLRVTPQPTTAVTHIRSILAVAGKGIFGRDAMTSDAQAGAERARRFRDAVLPHIDDAYTFARFLMLHEADADAAVRECYLRALRDIDSFRGRSMKPWLFAILRNVCHARLARSGASADFATGEPTAEPPAGDFMPGRPDGAFMRRLVLELPMPLREAIVLRELCGISYGEIAEVVSVPIGTVVSRLAGARAMMLVAWKASDKSARQRPASRARGNADRQVALRVLDRPRNSSFGARQD
jgi:RNA polymerase sigma-70 factor (ECF subfamily)